MGASSFPIDGALCVRAMVEEGGMRTKSTVPSYRNFHSTILDVDLRLELVRNSPVVAVVEEGHRNSFGGTEEPCLYSQSYYFVLPVHGEQVEPFPSVCLC